MRRLSIVSALFFLAQHAVIAQSTTDLLASDREASAQLSKIVESVRTSGLPVEPVVAQARRGALIHAPSARIISAAQAVANRLVVAREALGPRSADADLAAGENALAVKGVTKDMLESIRAAQPAKTVAVPLGVMAQLVASGVAPEQAAEIVSRLIRAGATNVQLVSLGNDVNQDVTAGGGAMASLQVRLETLRPLLARAASVPSSAQTILGPATATGRGRP